MLAVSVVIAGAVAPVSRLSVAPGPLVNAPVPASATVTPRLVEMVRAPVFVTVPGLVTVSAPIEFVPVAVSPAPVTVTAAIVIGPVICLLVPYMV